MTNDDLNNLNLMLARGIYRTQFESVSVPFNDLRGVQIGEGKCVAVILHLNQFHYNTTVSVLDANPLGICIYYGDKTKQQRELFNGQTSPILFCSDLSEIYVRAAVNWSGATDTNTFFEVQLEIYHGKDDDN